MKHFLNQRVIATTELSESVVSDIETFLFDQKVFNGFSSGNNAKQIRIKHIKQGKIIE